MRASTFLRSTLFVIVSLLATQLIDSKSVINNGGRGVNINPKDDVNDSSETTIAARGVVEGNNGNFFKISYQDGEIIVPSDRKNVHIKTIDVYEEKSPDFLNKYGKEDTNKDENVGKQIRSSKPNDKAFNWTAVKKHYDDDSQDGAEDTKEVAKKPSAVNLLQLSLDLIENGVKIIRDLSKTEYSEIGYRLYKIIDAIVKFFTK